MRDKYNNPEKKKDFEKALKNWGYKVDNSTKDKNQLR